MRKLVFLIFLLPLLLTGCFGESGSGNLTSICQKTIDTNVLKETDTYTINYKEGNISTIILVKSYTGMNLESSLITYQKSYENSKGVHIDVGENDITYNFDMLKVSDEIKKVFDLKDTYNEQVKLLKDIGFTCD